jgi:hypothetical protein
VTWRETWTVLKDAARELIQDDAFTQAAIAFYTALGLAPTVLLCLAVGAFLGEGITDALLAQIELVVRSAEERPDSRALSAIVGIVTMLVSASGIFVQLQSALNRIWEVRVRPDAGYWTWVKARLLALGLLLGGHRPLRGRGDAGQRAAIRLRHPARRPRRARRLGGGCPGWGRRPSGGARASREPTRNAPAVKVDWPFTTDDARVKRKEPSPTIQLQ